MSNIITPKNALISVFHKEGLAPIINKLNDMGINIYSTGGTEKFIAANNINVHKVEDLTSYPSILGGRVKTLHPKIFGGILSRRNLNEDKKQLAKYEIPEFDIVIVDLYPFNETVKSTNNDQDIIEKIDIGGISLIRAAAKNFNDVLVVSSRNDYDEFLKILNKFNGSRLEDRKQFAKKAFKISSKYDSSIFSWLNEDNNPTLDLNTDTKYKLRYGENPHQNGVFFGDLDGILNQLNGKDISYNNLLDIDSAVSLINEFEETTFAILKHNNACGLASRKNLNEAWNEALSGDPISAFGGVLICNKEIDEVTAESINKIFCEIIIAPSFNTNALNILKTKKNRIILVLKDCALPKKQFRTILNGVLEQDKDLKKDTISDMKPVTKNKPSEKQLIDLEFASKICKNTKSNTIVLAKSKKLLSSGVGQTSRIDALKQAITKAKQFGFDLNGAVMASDAFFPFPDCVEIASKEGISAIIQPGGSINDQLSIDCCNENNMAMVMTGTRHFKH